ncbi:hypothetical protein PGB34_18815 [Xenophilus arseniciresistens]|uniref:Uncharacterized protein n=1 Tax=Xenophilus arseniciresistens TaxID=1283306 RepID=A0AAE3NB65_9BURK|nr:hypothetical protein [Xenophilus arseniciresistens]MDA7418426.1 hypothetical protein [Xenophilus arseniciresistens]
MNRRPNPLRHRLANALPKKTLLGAGRLLRMTLVGIASLGFIGITHAQQGVQVYDTEARSTLKEINKNIGDGDLNKTASSIDKTASSIDKTASNILKEIQTKVSKLAFTATLTPNNQLQKVTSTAMVVQKACPGQGSIASQQLTSLTTLSSGDPTTVKQRICQELIQLRVQALNDSVEMVNRFQKYSEQLTEIDSKRESISNQGDLWANTNESLRTLNKLQAEMGFWRTRLGMYEAAIKFHETQQNALTQASVKGNQTAQLIQTGALAAALAIR